MHNKTLHFTARSAPKVRVDVGDLMKQNTLLTTVVLVGFILTFGIALYLQFFHTPSSPPLREFGPDRSRAPAGEEIIEIREPIREIVTEEAWGTNRISAIVEEVDAVTNTPDDPREH